MFSLLVPEHISNVKWADKLSREFRVPLGIKQGGINLPELFGCYIDDICAILRNADVGCHMYGIFLAMIREVNLGWFLASA